MKIPTAKKELYGVFKHLPKMNKAQFTLFKKLMLKTVLTKNIITVTNKNTGLKIVINQTGVSHSLNYRGTVKKTKSFTVLTEILEKAVLSGLEPDKESKNKIVLFFTSLVIVDGEIWYVKITIKEGTAGKLFYHHDLVKTKRVLSPESAKTVGITDML